MSDICLLNNKVTYRPRKIQVIQDDDVILANFPESMGLGHIAEIVEHMIVNEKWEKLLIQRVF